MSDMDIENDPEFGKMRQQISIFQQRCNKTSMKTMTGAKGKEDGEEIGLQDSEINFSMISVPE